MLMLLRELYKNAMYQASVHHMMLRKHGHLVGNYSSVLPGVLWDHKTVCLLLIVHLLHVGDILLLRENHLVALALCALALVAHFSEGEVVVEAPLTSPITSSLRGLLLISNEVGVLIVDVLGEGFLFVVLWSSVLFTFFRVGGFLLNFEHVFWLSLVIFLVFTLLASETLFSTLEVVVLAFAALPATIREVEVFSWLRWLFLGARRVSRVASCVFVAAHSTGVLLLGVKLLLRHGWDEGLREEIVDGDIVHLVLWGTNLLLVISAREN